MTIRQNKYELLVSGNGAVDYPLVHTILPLVEKLLAQLWHIPGVCLEALGDTRRFRE